MIAVDAFVAADRVVLAGLAAYDTAMARAWEIAAGQMAAAGHSADEIAKAAEGHQKRTLASRDKLHRDLWAKALTAVLEISDADNRAGEDS
jgi:hypothetical protein